MSELTKRVLFAIVAAAMIYSVVKFRAAPDDLEDGPSILISWTMLVTILIYVYPLKAVFGWMWYYLSNGRFGQALGVSSAAQARELFAVYAIGFSALAFEIWLLNFRAWQLRDALRLNARERVMTRDQLTGRCIPLGIGLLSLLLTLVLNVLARLGNR